MYAFDTVAVWKDRFTLCVTNWASQICTPFFQQYAPLIVDSCNQTVSYMKDQIAGLYDLPYPTYSYGYYFSDNRHVGLALSNDVNSKFSWIIPTVCSTQDNSPAFASCMLKGQSVAQSLSCNHAMYANEAPNSPANALNYVIPVVVTAYLCWSNSSNYFAEATSDKQLNCKPKL